MSRRIIKEIILDRLSDENTYLILGDVGVGVFDKIDHPRIINFGIREQSMVSFAAGMAAAGANVIVYSIAPFVTTRAAEQIKIDICQQNLPVCLIGVGSGFSYSLLGPTHHCLEDIPILGSFPNMTIKSPYFPEDFENLLKFEQPEYIRISNDPKVDRPLLCGTEVLNIVSGNMMDDFGGNKNDTYYVKDIKPFDSNIPVEQYKKIQIYDESYQNGFASMFILKYLDKLNGIEVIINSPDEFAKKCGSQEYLRSQLCKKGK